LRIATKPHSPYTIRNTQYEKMKLLALIGYPLSHSFSKGYFTEKFQKLGISDQWEYTNFSIESIEKLPDILRGYPNLCGINVTIPHKENVLPFLDEIDPQAAAIGAVNCIKITNGKLKGYNTDAMGFEKSLLGLIGERTTYDFSALVLGTGGAAKAVGFSLEKLGIPYKYVSRQAKNGSLSYDNLTETLLKTHRLLINTTPLGMSPNTEGCPPIPFQLIDSQCFLYDLIYNPAETTFLRQGRERGAATKAGLDMLLLQAEAGWAIWNQVDA
jgi:shikimate dehydrogenase